MSTYARELTMDRLNRNIDFGIHQLLFSSEHKSLSVTFYPSTNSVMYTVCNGAERIETGEKENAIEHYNK